MECSTILTVKQVAFEALLRSLRLYMEQDECVCDAFTAHLPLFAGVHACPSDCEQCTWCIARTALDKVSGSAILLYSLGKTRSRSKALQSLFLN